MSRILVTGGSGRLGVSVVRGLAAAGHEVISVDHTSTPGLPAEQVEHDLLDAAGTEALFVRLAPQAVIHLAAIAVPFSAPERTIFETNTRLAFTVLEATLACGADRLLVASSPTVMGYGAPGGWLPDYLPIDEEHPIAPWNAYSLSKQVIENVVAMGVRAHGDRVRFGIFRPCFVIAPEEWAGAPTQQGHTVADRLADPALSAVALFNYLDARDAADFVIAWLEHAATTPNGTCYFVAAADSLTTGDVRDQLPHALPGTETLVAGLEPTAALFSSERAARLLGWHPTRSWRTELATEQKEVAHG